MSTFYYKKQSPIPELLRNVDSIFLYGHRGLSGHKPENTLGSFAYAINHNMNGIELDVQKTADGSLVVFHDKDLCKINNDTTPITSLTYDSIKNININIGFPEEGHQYIPTLEDAIISIPKSTVVSSLNGLG